MIPTSTHFYMICYSCRNTVCPPYTSAQANDEILVFVLQKDVLCIIVLEQVFSYVICFFYSLLPTSDM